MTRAVAPSRPHVLKSALRLMLRNRRTFKSVSFYALAGVLTCKYRVFGKPRINLPDFNSKTVQKIIELPGSLQIQIRQISEKV